MHRHPIVRHFPELFYMIKFQHCSLHFAIPGVCTVVFCCPPRGSLASFGLSCGFLLFEHFFIDSMDWCYAFQALNHKVHLFSQAVISESQVMRDYFNLLKFPLARWDHLTRVCDHFRCISLCGHIGHFRHLPTHANPKEHLQIHHSPHWNWECITAMNFKLSFDISNLFFRSWELCHANIYTAGQECQPSAPVNCLEYWPNRNASSWSARPRNHYYKAVHSHWQLSPDHENRDLYKAKHLYSSYCFVLITI